MVPFYARLTAAGEAAFVAAAMSDTPVNIKEMAVGDGGGKVNDPGRQTDLVNAVYRAPLNRLIIADKAENIIRAEMLIFPQAGGWWMREAALYDDNGQCLAVASLPPSYKPQLTEGSGRFSAVNIYITVSNTASVQLLADPSVILATMSEVNKAKSEAKDYTDEVAAGLDSDLKEIISNAVSEAINNAKRDFWNDDNPVGTVRFYAKKVDPNTLYPWSTWVYTGENKSIRIGKSDGTNVGQTGGSDTIKLTRAQMPAVQIDVSAETSEQAEKTLTTKKNGKHKHGGVPSRTNPWEIGGDILQKFNPSELGDTEEAGEHDHEVVIPAHKHTVDGKTENLGEGTEINIVEAHILMMCWARTA